MLYENLFRDPVALKQKLYSDLEKGGIQLDTTGSPASMLIESTVMTVSGALQSIGINNRRKFSSLAESMEDIYYHLHDDKIKDVFSSPGKAKFNLLYSRPELKSIAVPVPGERYSKLVIPAYTYFVANDKEYTLLRPINILFYENGSTRIVYESNIDNPVQPLVSNQVPWSVTRIGATEVIMLEVELLQVKRRVLEETMQLGKTFTANIGLTDKFHYCRVFDGANGSEYSVTFNEELKDPTKPTAIVRYLGDKLQVTVPSTYSSRNMVSRTLNIEVYVTSGEINESIDLLQEGSIGTTYGDGLVNPNDSIYSSPLTQVGMHTVLAITKGTGGKNGMSLDQVLNQIKYGGDNDVIPFDAMQHDLDFSGFKLSTIEEDILKRTFLATKELPSSDEDSFATGIAAAIDKVKLTLNNLSNVSTVIDNDLSITILPGTLFKYNNGVPELVPDYDMPHNKTNSTADLANELNSNTYAYVPIHYVLDSSYDKLTMEPYYLNDPKVMSRNFVQENLSLDYSIKTLDVKVSSTEKGYKLIITSSLNDSLLEKLSDVRLLVKFNPVGERKDAARLATLSSIDGKYAFWEVDIETNYELSRDHNLNIGNFIIHDDTEDDFFCSLEEDFKLVYVMYKESKLGYEPTAIDDEIPTGYIGKKFVGLTHEKVRLHLGRHLSKLWSNSRTIPGPWDWEVHEYDVPRVYDEVVYKKDDEGNFLTETVDGIELPIIEHNVGDPVLINGEPDYIFKKGHVVRDENGEPKVKSPDRGSERVLELLLVDGVYRYANSAVDELYAESVPKLITNIIDLELDDKFDRMGENTSFKFSPKKTLGDIPVIVDSGTRVSIPTNLSFEVDVYMTGEKKQDGELISNIKSNIPDIISNSLLSETIDIKDIQSKIKDFFSGDIEAVDLKVKGHETIKVMTPVNKEQSPAIKRKLSVLRDNQLVVVNDVLINPIAHKTIIS